MAPAASFRRASRIALDLVEPLLLFIHAHREKFDYRLRDAQTAFQLVNQSTTAFDGQYHIQTIVETADAVVSQAAPSPSSLCFSPRRPSFSHRVFQRGDQFVLIFFGHVRAHVMNINS